jgi:membrane-associated protease RseP (regulator of RpoE activity)
MSRRLTALAVSLAVLAAVPLAAQSTPAPAPRSPKPPKSDSMVFVMDSMRIRLDSARTRSYYFRDSMQPMMAQAFALRRVRIGVVVRTRPSDTDSLGAMIDAVTPGGPAATAGLQAGDVITRFGTTPLAVSLAKVPAGTRVPSPGFRLVELVAKLPPNDTVAVEYRRGKSRMTTRVVTAADPENFTVVVDPEGGAGVPGMPGAEYWVGGGEGMEQRALDLALRRSEMARGSRGEAGEFTFMMSDALPEIELAPVNPQLGSYFGTTEGVLVVDVPEPAPLGLKAGDVVLAVDGRAVSSPRQLLRVLGSYEPGEPLQLTVMRQKKRITLKGALGR